MLTTILLTQSTTPIIGWVAWVLGKIMALLFTFCDTIFGSANIGVCIILFTIIVNLLMLPLTIKQQKFSKLSAHVIPLETFCCPISLNPFLIFKALIIESEQHITNPCFSNIPVNKIPLSKTFLLKINLKIKIKKL